MTESATSTRLQDIFPDLDVDFPDQLEKNKEFVESKRMPNANLVFSVLCNATLFGAPLYSFLERADRLDEYVEQRSDVVNLLQAIRTDLLEPTLRYKIGQIRRLRYAIKDLPKDNDPVRTVTWFYKLLQSESKIQTDERTQWFASEQSLNTYQRKHGRRLSTIDAE